MKLNGWMKMGIAPVYEHSNGTRVHAGGMMVSPDGDAAYLNTLEYEKKVMPFFKLTGWNKRRAYIAYADSIYCR